MTRAAALVAPAVPIPLTPSGALPERTRWFAAAEDVLLAIAVVLCIPLVILVIGIPIASVVRLLLWIARLV